jgi:hypothetical protein
MTIDQVIMIASVLLDKQTANLVRCSHQKHSMFPPETKAHTPSLRCICRCDVRPTYRFSPFRLKSDVGKRPSICRHRVSRIHHHLFRHWPAKGREQAYRLLSCVTMALGQRLARAPAATAKLSRNGPSARKFVLGFVSCVPCPEHLNIPTTSPCTWWSMISARSAAPSSRPTLAMPIGRRSSTIS